VLTLDIGQKVASFFLSRPRFFNRGRTYTVLKHAEDQLLANNMLAVVEMIGTKILIHDFNNDVDMTSSGEDLAGMPDINLAISAEGYNVVMVECLPNEICYRMKLDYQRV
jgi:hypothetical protein